jgi:hypothetical protein
LFNRFNNLQFIEGRNQISFIENIHFAPYFIAPWTLPHGAGAQLAPPHKKTSRYLRPYLCDYGEFRSLTRKTNASELILI